MKEHEMILGYAEYNSNKYSFVYDNGVLTLIPETKIQWGKRQIDLLHEIEMMSNSFKVEHEWSPSVYIRGITNKGKNILFISNLNGDNNSGFMQYKIQVIYVYDSKSSNGELIEGLTITADEIDYFFQPSRVFNSKFTVNKNNICKDFTINASSDINNTIECGNYSSGDSLISMEISAYPTFSLKSNVPLSAQSEICFEFDKGVVLDKALEIVSQLKTFLRYVSYRKNVHVRNINVFRLNEKGLRSIEGEIYIISNEIIETNEDEKKEVLTFELLEGKTTSIFQLISDGKLYLDHICNCVDDKRSYNIARIILIFAAFEREYNSFDSKPVRSKEYLSVKANVLDFLNKEKETAKEKGLNKKSRKYIDGYIKMINKSDNSLSACIKNAINKNIGIVRIFLQRNYNNDNEVIIDSIAERMKDMRNNIAHGNLDLKIEAVHISDLAILEILIYVMALSSLNITETSIQKSICKLFGYNMCIPNKSEVIKTEKRK